MKTIHDESELSAYLDGEVNPEQAARIEQHLHECAPCRATLTRWQKIQILARRDLPFPVSPFFATRVMARYRAKIYESVWNDFAALVQPFLRVAAVVALILLGLLILPGRLNLFPSAAYTSYDSIFQENQEMIQSLNNSDQVLQFALSQPIDSFGGEK